jgi:tetratricopeptide (TPR) repeat protein
MVKAIFAKVSSLIKDSGRHRAFKSENVAILVKMVKAIFTRANSLIKDSGGYKVFIFINIAILALVLVLMVIQQSWIKKEKDAIKSIINSSGNEIEHVNSKSLNESKNLLAKDVRKENKSNMFANSLYERKKAIFNIEKKIKEADMYYEYGQYEKASTIYSELINTNITSEWGDKVFNRLSECYYNLGDFKLALELYRKVYNNYLNSPYSLNAQLRMGECLILMGDFDEARRVLYNLVGQEAKYEKAEDELKVIEAYYKIADSYIEQAKTHLNKGGKDNLH